MKGYRFLYGLLLTQGTLGMRDWGDGERDIANTQITGYFMTNCNIFFVAFFVKISIFWGLSLMGISRGNCLHYRKGSNMNGLWEVF